MLSDLRVFESSAFVAAPLAGMTLAQLGADVIRIDPIAGGPDRARWPVTREGVSLYWAGLNKGKRSVAIDFSRPEGRELASALVAAPGPNAGILVSNFPESGWLADAALRSRRSDLVYVSIVGNPDGSTAVDYTVNAASGIASATGPRDAHEPVNNAIPAWDVAAGLNAVVAVLAAERRRRDTGEGALVKISLADVAFGMVANLGFLAEAELNHENRPPLGNDLYGAFGRDFPTADDRRVMVVAISASQWQRLVRATATADEMRALEHDAGLHLDREADRYQARDAVAEILAPWFAARPLDDVRATLDEHGVCWDVYQTFTQLLSDDARASTANPIFAYVDQPDIGPVLTPASPLRLPVAPPRPSLAAPRLGAHTEDVLADVLSLSPPEITSLREAGIVGARDE
jgi:2-methylfumaryl-CoA isomerase